MSEDSKAQTQDGNDSGSSVCYLDESEVRGDTISMCVVCSLMAIAGIVLACIEGPQFNHGLMIGVGSTMVLLSLWRQRALLGQS